MSEGLKRFRDAQKEDYNDEAPIELTDREVYDIPIGPVCMSKTEHEAYVEEQKLQKK